MSRFLLLLRSLFYFRWSALAVVAGMAVATAVLTGALMVGDSVRGSLRDLALQRLGPIDHALAAPRFFPDDLAGRLSKDPDCAARFAPVVAGITVRGGAADETGKNRTAGVQINAFGDWVRASGGQCIISPPLADALNIQQPGATVLLSVPSIDDAPRDATLARRGRSDVTSGLRLKAARLAAPDELASLFSLAPSQRVPANAWVDLRELQEAISQPGRANLLMAKSAHGQLDVAGATALNAALRRVVQLRDYGLEIGKSADGREARLSSTSTYIVAAVDRAAEDVAKSLKIPLRRTSVYLINHVTLFAGTKSATAPAASPAILHYAVAAGISALDDGAALRDNEVALNQWAAEQLGAKVGDRVRLEYYERQPNGDLRETTSDRPGQSGFFRIARIIPMTGIGADPSLTPTYKGLTDADSVADWKPPAGLDIDKSLVTKADEDYWRKHRAAPKLFVSLAAAKRLWGDAFGDINSIRLPAARADEFAAALGRNIDPAAMGMAFMPVKAQQLAAAGGSTDFAQLFMGFSFFLIAAAVLLVAMLFRLNIEQRARQFGLLSAVGFTPRSLRRMALSEGWILAVSGAVIGSGLAIAYTALVMFLLRTVWIGAVGTTSLRLHLEPATLLMGLASSLAIALLAVLWAVWRLGRAPAAALLAGAWGMPDARPSRRPLVGTICGTLSIAIGGGLIALAMLQIRSASPTPPPLAKAVQSLGEHPQEPCMMGGAMLLAGGLCIIGSLLRRVRRDQSIRRWSIGDLALRNAGRRPARSIVTMCLVALATFSLVLVAAMRQGPPKDTHRKRTPTGGYQLILTADVPLPADLNTPAGREVLGIDKKAWPLLERAHFRSMRMWAGQDISCLNLTRPTSPTILAIPRVVIDRNGFVIARSLDRDAKNPWMQLLDAQPDGSIPVIADEDTASYVLHLDLGQTMSITDQAGRPRTLRLVATLAHSIFQGQLLMGEGNFLRLFPSQSGFGVVLVDATNDIDVPDIRRRLSSELDDFAVTVERTSDRLARYQQVANTYLSTFQALGSLGLMLVTIGLAVVLLRNLLERRAELALLAAIGFAPRARLALILRENAFLLVCGMALGAICALLGVLPAIQTSARAINWAQLGIALAAILAAGLLALLAAARAGQRQLSLAALRQEC